MDSEEMKREVVFYAKILDRKGLVNSLEGNISVYDREVDLLYITPSGTRKSMLDEKQIAVMQGNRQIGGSKKRSSEYLLHQVALKARPDCNAVVHVHAPYMTAYAYCQKSINIKCSTTFAVLHDEIPCIPYGEPGGIEITNGLEEAIQGHDIVLLANHGLVCVAKTLEHACAVVEATEEVLKIYELAKGMGVSDLSDEQLTSLRRAKRQR